MNTKRLWTNAAPTTLTIDDFLWRRPSDGPQSMQANIGPNLAEFGAIPAANRDAVWLATTVFLADRTVSRPKGWERDFQIVIPSTNPDIWNAARGEIDEILSFLTSDRWETGFVQHVGESGELNETEDAEQEVSDVVCLFSGGADSVCGAVKALAEGRSVTLMSHWDFAGHSSVQSRLVGDLKSLFGVDIPHVRVNLGRSAKQIGGAKFPDEPSRRSRSLLFIALGLAVASARGMAPLWIAENGFTSLNPPLASERRGALSTRTTHPTFLHRFRGSMQAVGAHTEFTTPYSDMTKGEMFRSVADIIEEEQASALLSDSHSCSHVRLAMSYGRPPGTQCGVCFGCLVRRAAFIASGLEDRTTYLVTDLDQELLGEFLASTPGADIETMRYAVGRQFGMADVLGLNLPNGYDLDGALDLVRRGFGELAAVELP